MTDRNFDFKRPNRESVELGDLCILSGGYAQNPTPSRVDAVKEEGLVVNGSYPIMVEYIDAIILKKDGTYLIGGRASWSIEHREG